MRVRFLVGLLHALDPVVSLVCVAQRSRFGQGLRVLYLGAARLSA